jgi:hypothetical protein
VRLLALLALVACAHAPPGATVTSVCWSGQARTGHGTPVTGRHLVTTAHQLACADGAPALIEARTGRHVDEMEIVATEGDVAVLERVGYADRWQSYARPSKRDLGQPGDSGRMLYDSTGRAACIVTWGAPGLIRCVPVQAWRRLIPATVPRVGLGAWP